MAASESVFLKISQISVEDTFVTSFQACNFIKKRFQHKFFLRKIFENTLFYRTTPVAAFEENQQQKSFQRCFSDISFAQPISDNMQLSQ